MPSYFEVLKQIELRRELARNASSAAPPAPPPSDAADPPPTPSAATPARSDFTKIDNYETGCAKRALLIANDPSAVSEALRCYDEASLAPSSKRSRSSRLQTWDKVASALGIGETFSADQLKKVIAVLKASKYRSIDGYVSDAKTRMVRDLGGVWTQQHDAIRKQATVATKRGQGPPQGAEPFPVADAYRLPDSNSSLWRQNPTDPLHPKELIISGCWWLCREIEASRATLADVSFRNDKTRHAADWALSISKSDPGALGVHRTHSCTCSFSGPIADICPVCTLKKVHDARMSSLTKAVDVEPLFCARNGDYLTKTSVIETINRAGFLVNAKLKQHNNALSFGGHSLRRGGIAFLAASGVPRDKIKILARHSSGAIDKYLETSSHILAELAKNTAIMVAKFMTDGSSDGLNYTTTLQGVVRDQEPPYGGSAETKTEEKDNNDDVTAEKVDDKAATVTDEASPHGAVAKVLPQGAVTPRLPFVFVIRRGARVHSVNPFFPKLALCGWQFDKCNKAVRSDSTEPMRVFGDVQLCLKCVRAQHDADSDSDGESSSASSES